MCKILNHLTTLTALGTGIWFSTIRQSQINSRLLLVWIHPADTTLWEVHYSIVVCLSTFWKGSIKRHLLYGLYTAENGFAFLLPFIHICIHIYLVMTKYTNTLFCHCSVFTSQITFYFTKYPRNLFSIDAIFTLLFLNSQIKHYFLYIIVKQTLFFKSRK